MQPQPNLSAQLWQADVFRALEELDELERTALRLIYLNGLTQAQVARRLALPETTVKTSVAHGMHELAVAVLR